MIKTMKSAIALVTFVLIAAIFVLADVVVAQPDPRTTKILETIGELVDGPVGNFTRKGKPRVSALEQHSGLDDISAAERDAAWAQFDTWRGEMAAKAAKVAETERLKAAVDAARKDLERARASAKVAESAKRAWRERARDFENRARAAESRATALKFRTDELADELRSVRSGGLSCAAQRERLAERIGERWASGWRDDARWLLRCLEN